MCLLCYVSRLSDCIAALDCTSTLQYKFIVDGDWKHDPNQRAMRDENGNVNNVIEVQEYVPENLENISGFDPPPSPAARYARSMEGRGFGPWAVIGMVRNLLEGGLIVASPSLSLGAAAAACHGLVIWSGGTCRCVTRCADVYMKCLSLTALGAAVMVRSDRVPRC